MSEVIEYINLYTLTADAGISRANSVNKMTISLNMLDLSSMKSVIRGQESKVRAIRAIQNSYNTNHTESVSVESMRDAFLSLSSWCISSTGLTLNEYVVDNGYHVTKSFSNIAKECGVVDYPLA